MGSSIGRYRLGEVIASGGMGTVHVGRTEGAAGFSRRVAIKRLQRRVVADPEFAAMLVDEARLASHIHHANVVSMLDVVQEEGELWLIMEYVQGESLSRLLRKSRASEEPPPLDVVIAIVLDMLYGLSAAHQACDECGDPLHIVHRDVSPQNVLVSVDGTSRITDFGIAKATHRLQITRTGQLKGKLNYMAPEQLRGKDVTSRVDIYATGVVLWEMLTQSPLFEAEDEAALYGLLLEGNIRPPSDLAPQVPEALDAAVMRALARDPSMRFPTASAMAVAIAKSARCATAAEVGAWVESLAGDVLRRRALPGATASEPEGRHTETELSARDPSTREPSTFEALGPGTLEPGTVDAPTLVRPKRDLPPRPRSQRGPLLAIALLSALAVLLVLALTRERTPMLLVAGISARAQTSDLSVPPSESASAKSAPAPSEEGPQLGPSAPSSSALSRVPSSRVPSSSAPSSSSRRAAGAKPGPDCDPPYITDSTGFRHVKRECL